MPVVYEYCKLMEMTSMEDGKTSRYLALQKGYEVTELSPASLMNQLNVLGAQGWKMVGHGITTAQLKTGIIEQETYILMREIQP